MTSAEWRLLSLSMTTSSACIRLDCPVKIDEPSGGGFPQPRYYTFSSLHETKKQRRYRHVDNSAIYETLRIPDKESIEVQNLQASVSKTPCI
ncbi:hypothetical protein F5Y19DRAFT_441400 [Xylariaceae sp. FL1651]|nr:hypothetical protein F5Y19DRAFT_441400 [Xylariaceae sp. FL1651]